MNASAALFTIRWLIRDTFRQALASGIFWLMLGITTMCIAVCLTVNAVGDVQLQAPDEKQIEALPRAYAGFAASEVFSTLALTATPGNMLGANLAPLLTDEYKLVAQAHKHNVPVVSGYLELAFGAIRIPLARDKATAVRTVEFHLAGWIADGAGLLLALIWTAGFLPSFLEPSAASVLLAKPVPRWSLLAGKFLGVLVFVAAQNALFVAGTWAALGIRTDVWDPTYFVCVPMLLLHFAVFYSFSAMLAVMSRSTVVCVLGSIMFWLFCMAMNSGRHWMHVLPEFGAMSPLFSFFLDAGYWILPKPLDFHILLRETLGADDFFARVVDHKALAAKGYWQPVLSVFASLTAGVVLLTVAAYDFLTADY
jgi:ABC-type transport system involved in multi-copper enzyme maturation permease subunit